MRRLGVAVTVLSLIAVVFVLPVPAPAGAEVAPLKVLIMGDSYSAGNGAGDYENEECFRSPNVWGQQSANHARIIAGRASMSVTNRACSGGVMADIIRPRNFGSVNEGGDYFSSQVAANAAVQAKCLMKSTSDPDEYWTGRAKVTSITSPDTSYPYYQFTCTRQRSAQVDAVKPDKDLVLLTIGGNDLKFAEVVKFCLLDSNLGVDTRRKGRCKARLDSATSMLSDTTGPTGMYKRLKATVAAIDSKLNPPSRTGARGKIVLLSYPHLISNDDYTYSGIKVGAIMRRGADDLQAIQQRVMNEINEPNAGACRNRVGVYGPGVAAAFDGHEPHAPVQRGDMEDVWLFGLVLPLGVTMHPNTDGQIAMRQVATNALIASDFRTCVRTDDGGLGGFGYVSAGTGSTCAGITGGTVECWGDNRYGKLGDGTTTDTLNPVTVKEVSGVALTGVTMISPGIYHSCALSDGGSVKCWGFGPLLGDGTTTDTLNPVTVKEVSGVALTGATAIATGYAHSCALIVGGSVKCWGVNSSGELGDGTTTDTLNPVTVKEVSGAALTGATAISAGGSSSCALITGGTVKCWGFNQEGVLGDGTTTTRLNPATVKEPSGAALTGAAMISTGGGHSCALIAGGSVKCWGRNAFGELGDGTTGYETNPVTVKEMSGAALTGATAISAGGSSSCALITGGTVKCWGFNAFGELGDGTTTNKLNPVSVSELSGAAMAGAAMISSGGGHSCALVAGGTVKCWGENAFGQLGDGTTTYKTNPVTVKSV